MNDSNIVNWRFLHLLFQEKEKGPNIADALLHFELDNSFLERIDFTTSRERNEVVEEGISMFIGKYFVNHPIVNVIYNNHILFKFGRKIELVPSLNELAIPKVSFSEEFKDLLESRIELLFIHKLGLPMSVIRNHFLSLGGNDGVFLGPTESVIKTNLIDEFYIKWNSEEGYKHIKPDEINFDPSKIKIWLEGFPTEKILKSINSKKNSNRLFSELQLKMKINEEYLGLNNYFTLNIIMRDDYIEKKQELVTEIDQFLGKYKFKYKGVELSEGFIQRYNLLEEHVNGFYYDIELGTAGIQVIRDLLGYLDTFNTIFQVEINDFGLPSSSSFESEEDS